MRYLAAILALMMILITAASAHMGATGIVKKRMDAMSEMKSAMATIGKMVTGRTGFDRAKGTAAARLIEKHAEEMSKLFPNTPESRQKATKATAEVWSDQVRFEALALELAGIAVELRSTIKTGDISSVKPVFRKTGKSCSACHQDFRQPDA